MKAEPKPLELNQLVQRSLDMIAAAQSLADLETVERGLFHKSTGELAQYLRGLKNIAAVAVRKIQGERANQAKVKLKAALTDRRQQFQGQGEPTTIDLTLPGIPPRQGHLHPLTQVIEELIGIFATMGFMVYEGPEMDNEFYNFEALNVPATHPARDIQDTFFIKTPLTRVEDNPQHKDFSKSRYVMRTQTSSMQVRLMEQFQPPLRCIVPGRAFRNEATDASHEHTFYQLEGFVVDENISIGHLVGTLRQLFSEFYKKPVQIRLRPGYFPFTEPSYEPDMSCTFCDQKGCKVCQHTGWVEMGGSGMIHPNVFKAAGYPDRKYTGFAFGMGINRLAMLKYDIDDGRRFMENDLRFLQQF